MLCLITRRVLFYRPIFFCTPPRLCFFHARTAAPSARRIKTQTRQGESGKKWPGWTPLSWKQQLVAKPKAICQIATLAAELQTSNGEVNNASIACTWHFCLDWGVVLWKWVLVDLKIHVAEMWSRTCSLFWWQMRLFAILVLSIQEINFVLQCVSWVSCCARRGMLKVFWNWWDKVNLTNCWNKIEKCKI